MPNKIESDVEVIVTWRGNPRNHDGANPKGGRVNLGVDDRLEFGISSRNGAFLPNAVPGIGAFEVSGSHLLLSNFTTSSTFVIENLEGGAELVKARPRRLGMVIPFEMSRILIPSDLGIIELTVFAPPPAMLRPERAATAVGSDMFKLDTTSKYFAVLAALCEPRLRGSSMAAVPSVHEVVERLRSTDQFKGANRSSINYHVEYLADQKLPISRWAKYVDGGRMHSKREALVAFALRFDLVREEHLSLLPGPVRDDPPTPSADQFAFCDRGCGTDRPQCWAPARSCRAAAAGQCAARETVDPAVEGAAAGWRDAGHV